MKKEKGIERSIVVLEKKGAFNKKKKKFFLTRQLWGVRKGNKKTSAADLWKEEVNNVT